LGTKSKEAGASSNIIAGPAPVARRALATENCCAFFFLNANMTPSEKIRLLPKESD
jgi:hypothetical protein